jgi:predicted anti-sigma-YlaC factor YlaD
MSLERREICAAHRAALLREMYEDGGEMPPALRAHLATCATCRAALEAAHRISGALREPLRPQALSEQAVQTLRRRLAAEPARHRLARRRLARLMGTAVAAGLMVAFFVPWRWHRAASRVRGSNRPPEIALSPEDAATIVAAYTCVGWEGTTETSASLLAEQVSGVARAVEREAGAETYLSWSRENDWDMPEDNGGALRGSTQSSLCSSAGNPVGVLPAERPIS